MYMSKIVDIKELKGNMISRNNSNKLDGRIGADVNGNVYKVVDNECSFGRSTVALQGIIHYYSNPFNRNNKVIWVTERVEDCEENAHTMITRKSFDIFKSNMYLTLKRTKHYRIKRKITAILSLLLFYNNEFIINGGILIAAGSSGMLQTPSLDSKINIIVITQRI